MPRAPLYITENDHTQTNVEKLCDKLTLWICIFIFWYFIWIGNIMQSIIQKTCVGCFISQSFVICNELERTYILQETCENCLNNAFNISIYLFFEWSLWYASTDMYTFTRTNTFICFYKCLVCNLKMKIRNQERKK